MRPALIAPLILLGCDAAPVTIPASVEGAARFADPRLSPSDFNLFTCATCHGVTPSEPAIASSLYGVVDREGWFGGGIQSLYEAVDFCYVYFMRGFPSLDPDSDAARSIYEYLDNQSDGQLRPARPMTVVEQIVDPGPGDAEAGAETWDRACAPCHGEAHTGRGRLGPTVAIVPEASLEFAQDNDVPVRLVVAEKVRHGQFFGVGGNMPFYPLERLSDEALADLLEYLAPP